ncbi:ABC transporter permease [Bacillus sp. FJAT-22090]|uniref:ABC transporter permease n=1 Tax=Bacillus sp. FJAT-22090 TaxID=1581038 RepID=UPI00119F51F8|nr:ABC transporter permease [Bacillus sp. FJAT-22090]
MTLFDLAKKNIQGNFGKYFVYFVSMVFSIIIYFTFVSLQYSTDIQESIMLSDMMGFLFLASSVLLLLFVATFILYSNAFFTRNRKKEVGLYSILGLRKKTIGKMLFYENLIMGVAALIVGISLGTLFSKLFAMVLVNLMGSTIEINFGLSIGATFQTIIVFLLIILFTSIQGYRLIYRFKLIELFQAEKKGEKQPKISPLSTSIGVVLLILSYSLILKPFPDELTNHYILANYGIAFTALVIGTHLFFRSVVVFLLTLLKKNRSRYYKGTNLIGTSQLLYRIRGNARTFSMIALLSAVTISLFGTTYSGYYGNEKASLEMVPFSYSHLSKSEEFDEKIESILKNDKEHPITAQLEIPVIEVGGELSFTFSYEANPMKLIPVNAYNEAAKALGIEELRALTDVEAAVIKPRLTEYKESLFQREKLHLSSVDRNVTFVKMLNGSVLPFDYPDFYIVVSDELFADISKQIKPKTYKVYEVEKEKTTDISSEKVSQLIDGNFQVHSSFYMEYKEGKEGNALYLFIFGFLGLVFLAATGSIIYFKQLTEANETKINYEILHKIGVNKKDIRQTINKQTLFVFGLPLIVGIVHSSVILKFVSNFISDLIGTNMMIPIITAMGAFIMIYVGYYVLTVNTYNKIVNK